MHEPEIDILAADFTEALATAVPDDVPASPAEVVASVNIPLVVFEKLQQVAERRETSAGDLIVEYIAAGLAQES